MHLGIGREIRLEPGTCGENVIRGVADRPSESRPTPEPIGPEHPVRAPPGHPPGTTVMRVDTLDAMHILIINFNLNDITHAEYETVCAEVAPEFAAIPGLVSKMWLANEATNTYGGVYLFENEQAMHEYQASELFKSVAGNPAFVNASATPFEMMAGPSKVTGVE